MNQHIWSGKLRVFNRAVLLFCCTSFRPEKYYHQNPMRCFKKKKNNNFRAKAYGSTFYSGSLGDPQHATLRTADQKRQRKQVIHTWKDAQLDQNPEVLEPRAGLIQCESRKKILQDTGIRQTIQERVSSMERKGDILPKLRCQMERRQHMCSMEKNI